MHSQLTAKKSKNNVNMEATQDGLTGSTFTVGQKWEESSSCGDLVEALHNYTACVFQIRPWDWSGILLQRVCHECAYFCHVVDDDGQQRNLLEKFIDEGLTKHRQTGSRCLALRGGRTRRTT